MQSHPRMVHIRCLRITYIQHVHCTNLERERKRERERERERDRELCVCVQVRESRKYICVHASESTVHCLLE